MRASAPAVKEESRELKPLVDIDSFRLEVPLQESSDYMGDSFKPACLICGRRFKVGRSIDWNCSGARPRKWYGLCCSHYVSSFFAADPGGRASAEALIQKRLLPLYRGAEFNTFKAAGKLAAHLGGVREDVVGWAKAVAAGWGRAAGGGNNAGSLYLYADRTRSHTGNGCGKTHLACSAFKYIARRTMAADMLIDPTDGDPVITCAFIDIQNIVAEFWKLKAKAGQGEEVSYGFSTWNGQNRFGDFNAYLANLAKAPFLFVDDIGRGNHTNRNGEPNLAATTAETITDLRASSMLPTLYTSNFAPDELGRRIGTRAASRVFRSGCSVIRIEAPDYAMAQSLAKGGAGEEETEDNTGEAPASTRARQPIMDTEAIEHE